MESWGEDTTPNSPEPKPEPESELSEGEFVVEQIKDRKKLKGKFVYLVAWKGYPDEDSWEPKENLSNCPNLVKEMDEKKDAEAKKVRKKPPRKAVRRAFAERKKKSIGNVSSDEEDFGHSSGNGHSSGKGRSTRKKRQASEDEDEDESPTAKQKRARLEHDAVLEKILNDAGASTIAKVKSVGESSIATTDTTPSSQAEEAINLSTASLNENQYLLGDASPVQLMETYSLSSRPLFTSDTSIPVARTTATLFVAAPALGSDDSQNDSSFGIGPTNFNLTFEDVFHDDDSMNNTGSPLSTTTSTALANIPVTKKSLNDSTGRSEISDFYRAIERFDVAKVNGLLNLHGSAFLQAPSLGCSLLTFAARRRDNEVHGLCAIIDVLVRYGLDIDYQNNHGDTALILLCKYGSPCCVIKLLQHQPHLDLVDQNLETALFAAVKRNNLPMIRALLTHGACASMRNNGGMHVMHIMKKSLSATAAAFNFLASFTKTMIGVYQNAVGEESQKINPCQDGAKIASINFERALIQLTWFSSFDRDGSVKIPFSMDGSESGEIGGAMLFLCVVDISPIDATEDGQNVIKATHKDDARLKTLVRKVLMNGRELRDFSTDQIDKLTYSMGESYYEENILEIQFNERFNPGEVLLVRANGLRLGAENVQENDDEVAMYAQENAVDAADYGDQWNGSQVTDAAGGQGNFMQIADADAYESVMDIVEAGAQAMEVAGAGAQDSVTQIVGAGAQENTPLVAYSGAQGRISENAGSGAKEENIREIAYTGYQITSSRVGIFDLPENILEDD